MGTQQTNDDGAMGLNLGPTNIDGDGVLDDPFDFDFVGTNPPMGHVLPPKASSVISDEARMVEVFAKCERAIHAMRTVAGPLRVGVLNVGENAVASAMLTTAADSLETAIALANGGAE